MTWLGHFTFCLEDEMVYDQLLNLNFIWDCGVVFDFPLDRNMVIWPVQITSAKCRFWRHWKPIFFSIHFSSPIWLKGEQGVVWWCFMIRMKRKWLLGRSKICGFDVREGACLRRRRRVALHFWVGSLNARVPLHFSWLII